MAHKCFFSVITGYSRARAGLWWPSRGWKWLNFRIPAWPQRGLGKNKGLISLGHAQHTATPRAGQESSRGRECGHTAAETGKLLQQTLPSCLPPLSWSRMDSNPQSPHQKQHPATKTQPSTSERPKIDLFFFFGLQDMGSLT